MSRIRSLVLVPVFAAVVALQAFAQSAGSSSAAARQEEEAPHRVSLATPTGNDLHLDVAGYNYTEPGETSISIHGPKIGAGYAGTFWLNRRAHWFVRADARGIGGSTAYDGWCLPFVITPNSASPNGWELGLGDPSPCSETGDKDWYLETRGVVGKDLIGESWGWSPYAGLGLRHLSNGITGVSGFRTDNYLYLPVGLTARTRIGAHRTVAFNIEYDRLLHGWQTTRDSQLGGGLVPATPTAPAFTIDGFTDISFDQHAGWGLRASATVQASRRWSLEPYYVHWTVSDSPVSYESVTFTVNNVSATERWGAYEPLNHTNEAGVKLGFHF